MNTRQSRDLRDRVTEYMVAYADQQLTEAKKSNRYDKDTAERLQSTVEFIEKDPMMQRGRMRRYEDLDYDEDWDDYDRPRRQISRTRLHRGDYDDRWPAYAPGMSQLPMNPTMPMLMK